MWCLLVILDQVAQVLKEQECKPQNKQNKQLDDRKYSIPESAIATSSDLHLVVTKIMNLHLMKTEKKKKS